MLFYFLVSAGVATVGARAPVFSAAAEPAVWPGSKQVDIVDNTDEFGENLSGLVYDGNVTTSDRTILWAVQNNPSTLYRLLWDDHKEVWTSDTNNDWGGGKSLKWMDGEGNPDTEDLVIPAVVQSQCLSCGLAPARGSSQSDLYMCTERNDVPGEDGVSRLSILRFAASDLQQSDKKKKKGDKSALVAAQEWRINEHLPTVGDNLGLEGITWIPDSHLVEGGFMDIATGAVYDPTLYPNHNGGVFVVGLEQNGVAYMLVLDEADNSSTLIGSFSPSQGYIMSLHYDAANRLMWSMCDNTCPVVTHTVLSLSSIGAFNIVGTYAAPPAINGMNLEGFAMAPESLCKASSDASGELMKTVYWADDGNDQGHSIRQGSVLCGNFI
jgi:hypothetical protein